MHNKVCIRNKVFIQLGVHAQHGNLHTQLHTLIRRGGGKVWHSEVVFRCPDNISMH
jgi:hypothetical protein